MLTSLIKFLTFAPDNVSKVVYWALAVIYTLLLLATLLSIRKKNPEFTHSLAWSLLVILLPVIGIATHCIRCLATADYQFLKQLYPPPQQDTKNWNS